MRIPMRTVSRILAATDFSPASDAALIRAGQIAAEHGAELRIIHATPDWNLFSNHAPMAQQHYAELSRTAERLLEEAKDRIASEFAVHVISELHKGKASLRSRNQADQYAAPGHTDCHWRQRHTRGRSQAGAAGCPSHRNRIHYR
jgi:nucleotide-binding universal stress UspA family protein